MRNHEPLKIAFITDGDPVNRLVIARIAERFPPSRVFVVDWSGAKKKSRGRLSKLLRIGQLLDATTRQWAELRRMRWLRGHVEESASEFEREQTVQSTAINSKQVSAELLEQDVDLLIVCGAPILRKRIFDLPKIATINVHFGLSSAYRGQHTIFWPLLEQQFDKVGATVHLIDDGIDTGQVLIEYCPDISPADHEFSLDLKIGNGVVDPILEMLEELEKSGSQSLAGKPQSNTAKHIYARDRGFWNSMRLELKRMLGRNWISELPARTRKHYQTNPRPTLD